MLAKKTYIKNGTKFVGIMTLGDLKKSNDVLMSCIEWLSPTH